jgi:hypothetical protein
MGARRRLGPGTQLHHSIRFNVIVRAQIRYLARPVGQPKGNRPACVCLIDLIQKSIYVSQEAFSGIKFTCVDIKYGAFINTKGRPTGLQLELPFSLVDRRHGGRVPPSSIIDAGKNRQPGRLTQECA